MRAPCPTRLRPSTPRRPGALRILGLLGGLVTLALGGLSLASPPAADAVVVHRSGFEATVLGWTSWYGSYELPGEGAAWCIDHGLRAPDGELWYRPTQVAERTPDTNAAMAWVVTTHAGDQDPLRSAAVMLVLHDLAGAVYPYGRLDVDRLQVANLAGFGGREAELLGVARAFKAEALEHAHRRAPLSMSLRISRIDGGMTGKAITRVVDGVGSPLQGLAVQFQVGSESRRAVTGPDGVAVVEWAIGAGPAHVEATATLPDPNLHALAPTAAPAQRVAVPSTVLLSARADLAAPPAPPAPPTTAPPTTAPPTTTPPTTAPPTTTPPTTAPPTTTPPTTAPPTTTPPTSSTIAASTTSTTTPLTTPSTGYADVPPDVPPRTMLPSTGARSRGLTLVGIGLLCVGVSLRAAGLRGRRRCS